jgi:dTDP-4-dehydrorhamnose 3,5-epimerase
MKSTFKEIQVFRPEIFFDQRGAFFESFSSNINQTLNQAFIQDNHSFSYKNVVRGLHYQWGEPMGKFVRVVKGAVIDYFVDIREGSPTYGEYDSILLSETNNTSVWIPPGFAHGFEVLEEAIVLYKCSAPYNREGESGINPFDATINIPWRTKRDDMILSDKDLNAQTLAEYSKDPKF